MMDPGRGIGLRGDTTHATYQWPRPKVGRQVPGVFCRSGIGTKAADRPGRFPCALYLEPQPAFRQIMVNYYRLPHGSYLDRAAR